MRLLVDGFVSNVRKADHRLKRGGGVEVVPLESTGPDGQRQSHDPPTTDDHDEAFYREWVRALFEGAVEDLRGEAQAHGREAAFEVFQRYDLADLQGRSQPTYADIAAALGVTVATVTNHLAAMRRALRARVLDRLREVTGSDADFEAEAKRLLGTRR